MRQFPCSRYGLSLEAHQKYARKCCMAINGLTPGVFLLVPYSLWGFYQNFTNYHFRKNIEI